MRYDFTVHTFGCKVNTYDTGLLQARMGAHQQLLKLPELKESSVPRVHILNTCAVTAEATKEATKLVRRLKARDPFCTVVVTGCGAQVDGEIFDGLKAADLVVGNSHKGQLEQILDKHFAGELDARVFRSNIFRKEDFESGGGVEAQHTRAFLKIQDGCNSFCTYCVIPFARGKSRSLSIAELVRRVRELEAHGSSEVVLTGVHIGDYEDKIGDRTLLLHDLVAAVLEKTTIPRIRLSSLEPVELTSELVSLYTNPRLCPHFHMSIQSANTRILSAMRRKYDSAAVETALNLIAAKVPGAFVGMDVIAGFPGETEDEFADMYERLARLPWTRLHVFPYSERPGTKAATYDDRLSRDVKSLRAARLRELSSARFASAALAQVGKAKRVMILKSQSAGGLTETLSRDYWPVRLSEMPAAASTGQEIDVEIHAFDRSEASRMDGVLLGRALVKQIAMEMR